MTVVLDSTEKTLDEVAQIAASGEEVLLVRDGKTIARITPETVAPTPPAVQAKRRLGFLKDYGFKVPDDFNKMGREEIERMFYGEE